MGVTERDSPMVVFLCGRTSDGNNGEDQRELFVSELQGAISVRKPGCVLREGWEEYDGAAPCREMVFTDSPRKRRRKIETSGEFQMDRVVLRGLRKRRDAIPRDNVRCVNSIREAVRSVHSMYSDLEVREVLLNRAGNCYVAMVGGRGAATA